MGSRPSGLQMSQEAMLALAREAAELAVARIESLPDESAWDGEFKEGLERLLLESPPEEGRPAEEVLRQAVADILPMTTRLDHPRCFGFVPSEPTWPGVVADFLASAWNVNACTWLVASGPSQVELVVLDWFRRWLGYPDSSGGLLTSGGSAACVDAFVAAREVAGKPARPSVYMSDQSHSAQARAAVIVGVGREAIREVPTDGAFRLDMGALARAVAEDRAAGFTPLAICANAGTSSTGAIDPLHAMADFCQAEGIWLHVDAAYGGFAAITEKGSELLSGIERADSVGLDPHKWLFQPYEVGCLLVKDVRTLERVFGFSTTVLQDTVWGANHPNLDDRGLQLSRSFRALKIWMSIQTFGMSAFRRAVSKGMELAKRAELYIRESRTLELQAPASLGMVCMRVNPEGAGLEEETLEDVNREVLARLFWDDRAFVSSTSLHGTFSLRFCIINHSTGWDDVRETLEAMERFGKDALA
ncbi:MAG: aminotransferase class I/II-fold pyridoxal phosphate-dependent enzyme [Acidobacteriota bacterium]|nr:aminotransferase class I/II-fold pyridoxal phosphate-dependent enzyme [Acidobacteriota bacterium]MDE2922058.1 aminotransferase class I/II-fold pyridoxal phosphate-dependent enzyme [Acidobacteriota bacterium]